MVTNAKFHMIFPKGWILLGMINISMLLATIQLYAAHISIYFDPSISQLVFAAEDIAAVYRSEGFDASKIALDDLVNTEGGRKVILTLASNPSVVQTLRDVDFPVDEKMTQESFAIRTTENPAKTYWIIGGDVNGAMYGGLQLAENIRIHGTDAVFNEEQSPDILCRGIKFNIPFDKRSPTYYGNGFSEMAFRGTSTSNAIEHIWNLKFWSEWFDKMKEEWSTKND